MVISSGVCVSQMVDMQLDTALIFEDDVRFEGNFKRRLMRMMDEVEQAELDWDIMLVTPVCQHVAMETSH